MSCETSGACTVLYCSGGGGGGGGGGGVRFTRRARRLGADSNWRDAGTLYKRTNTHVGVESSAARSLNVPYRGGWDGMGWIGMGRDAQVRHSAQQTPGVA